MMLMYYLRIWYECQRLDEYRPESPLRAWLNYHKNVHESHLSVDLMCESQLRPVDKRKNKLADKIKGARR